MILLIGIFRPAIPEGIGTPDLEATLREIREARLLSRPYAWYRLKGDETRYWKAWDGRRIVVRLRPGYSPEEVLQGFDYRKAKGTPSYVITLPEGKRDVGSVRNLLNSLNAHPGVLFAEPMLTYRTQYWPNDPGMGTYLWGMWAIYADRAWDITRGNPSVKVCVVDEGVDYNHEDLSGNYAGGYDYVDLDNDPFPANASEMHGTHVSGTIGAVMDNARGVVGVAQIGILSCRALAGGSGTSEDIASCIRWCVSQGAKGINMSLGSSAPASEIHDAVIYATDSVSNPPLIVAASGNDGMNGVLYPAAYPEVVAVGAIDTAGQRAYFSNYGSELELVAPGNLIVSTVPFTDAYAYADGTSMASPHVAGVAALVFSKNPNLSADTVRAILDATAIDMGEYGKDYFYGYGLVNAYLALLATPSPTLGPTRRGNLAYTVRDGRLTARTEDGTITLYSADGRTVASGKSISVTLPIGVYFLHAEGYTYKVVVR